MKNNNNQQKKNIQLRELRPLLTHIFGNQLIIVHYTTKNLVQDGDNFANSIFGVHVLIKRNNNAAEENLHLVAKMPASTKDLQQILDSPSAFKKEIFMYEEIISHYNDLEKEAGVQENKIFDILPKYYKSRLSLNPDIDFDDNAVILMENLKILGYYNCNKIIGCDFEHSRVTIEAMARFHALGITSKYKKPNYFEILRKRSECLELNFDISSLYNHVLETIAKDPQIALYTDRCKNAMDNSYSEWNIPPVEPWSTIIHADFWVNNIMFHRDKKGRIDNVKFVDFQNYLFLSPLRELVFYLFASSSCTHDDIVQLIDFYYDTLLSILNLMGCDTELFNRENFNRKLDIDANLEVRHIALMLCVCSKSEQEIFVKRLRKFISYFVRHNWI